MRFWLISKPLTAPNGSKVGNVSLSGVTVGSVEFSCFVFSKSLMSLSVSRIISNKPVCSSVLLAISSNFWLVCLVLLLIVSSLLFVLSSFWLVLLIFLFMLLKLLFAISNLWFVMSIFCATLFKLWFVWRCCDSISAKLWLWRSAIAICLPWLLIILSNFAQGSHFGLSSSHCWIFGSQSLSLLSSLLLLFSSIHFLPSSQLFFSSYWQ